MRLEYVGFLINMKVTVCLYDNETDSVKKKKWCRRKRENSRTDFDKEVRD